MPRPRGPLSQTFTANLINFIERPAEGTSQRAKKEYQDRIKAWNAFREKYKSTNPKGNGMRELTYSLLPELLLSTNTTLRDAYIANGLTVPWPSAKFEKLLYLLETLSPEVLNRINLAVSSMAAPAWKDPLLLQERPSYRACYYLRNNQHRTGRLDNIPPAFAAAWADKKRFTTIPVENLLETSEFLGVSLHWLICPTEPAVRVYSSKPICEHILDAFCFLSDKDQDIILESVEKIVDPKDIRKGRGTKRK